MTEKVKRRLTTVLCADVYGYSRLMEADEAGTLATLRRYRTAMAALVDRHEGRIVNTWGDAVIAEFSSVVEAVQCAIETQQELSHQDPHVPEVQRMRFRIGINLGDVMVDGSDIYGDGVNIAARLQELAEPGGILISGPVYEQVYNKLSIGFDYLGRQQVKNVSAPVTSYRVAVNEAAARPSELSSGREADMRPAADFSAGYGAQPPHKGTSGTRVQAVSEWFAGLPRPIATLLVIGSFLFLINLFTGLHSIWFHWPVTAMLLIVALRMVFRRKPVRERRDQRRTERE